MSKKTFYAFITSFILLIAVIVLNRLSFDKMRGYSKEVEHTREVIASFKASPTGLKVFRSINPIIRKMVLRTFLTVI